MDNIELHSIGIVKSAFTSQSEKPLFGAESTIELDYEYIKGLKRIDEHSHLWILSWFHLAKRNQLTSIPKRVDDSLQEFGVFGLRSPVRPNPIALSLVELIKVEDNCIVVRGFDAIDGTRILDIKPYFEQDIIFSPKTPYISHKKDDLKKNSKIKEAFNQHQEYCEDLYLAVRMSLLAEKEFGKLTDNNLLILIEASGCIADCIQGLTRARLANPSRLHLKITTDKCTVTFFKENKRMTITKIIKDITKEQLEILSDEELFKINISTNETLIGSET